MVRRNECNCSLSGVATLAHEFAAVVQGTKCKVLDTRKTTPGLRRLEKSAAAAGGVTNHRMGLFDAILIKNNHIALAGGIVPALEQAIRKVETRAAATDDKQAKSDIKMVSDYAGFMAESATRLDCFYDVRVLPHPKEAIIAVEFL